MLVDGVVASEAVEVDASFVADRVAGDEAPGSGVVEAGGGVVEAGGGVVEAGAEVMQAGVGVALVAPLTAPVRGVARDIKEWDA